MPVTVIVTVLPFGTVKGVVVESVLPATAKLVRLALLVGSTTDVMATPEIADGMTSSSVVS